MNVQSMMLDVSKQPQISPVLYLGQGDKNGTTLEAAIYDGGIPLSLSGKGAVFALKSPNGQAYYEVSGTVSGNVATFAIDETYAASISGKSEVAYVEITEGDTVIASTNRFTVIVLESAEEGADPSQAYSSGIVEATERAIAAAEAAEGVVMDDIPTMSANIKGGAKLGDGLRITDGVLSVIQGGTVEVPTMTETMKGGAKLGSGLEVDSSEKLNVKVDGTTISVDSNGALHGASTYELPTMSANVKGGAKVGTALEVDANGALGVKPGTTQAIGGVKPDGTTITVDSDGTIHGANSYELPTMGASVKGGAKLGAGLEIDDDVLQLAGESYTTAEKQKLSGIESGANNYVLPAATASAIGGVKPDGTTITVAQDGTISGANTYTLPPATTSTLGGVIPDGTTITVDSNGTIHGGASGQVSPISNATIDAVVSDQSPTGTDSLQTTGLSYLWTKLKAAFAAITHTHTVLGDSSTKTVTVDMNGVAECSGTASGLNSHAEGQGTAGGSLTHAEGYSTANGTCAHAEGSGANAVGYTAHAEGLGTTATGEASHAEGAGAQTTSSARASHAEGSQTAASAAAAHAEGVGSTASGAAAHAEGQQAQARGAASHAEGTGTIAGSDSQHVSGKYNVTDSSDVYAEIVGNGTSETSSNARTLDWDGNAWHAGDVVATDSSNNQVSLVDLKAAVGTVDVQTDGSLQEQINDLGESVSSDEYNAQSYGVIARRFGNVVVIRAESNAISASGDVIATLPSGFRPQERTIGPASVLQGLGTQLVVQPNGEVFYYYTGSDTRTYPRANLTYIV